MHVGNRWGWGAGVSKWVWEGPGLLVGQPSLPPIGGLCSPISQGWMTSLHPTLSQYDKTWELMAWKRRTVEPEAGSISKTALPWEVGHLPSVPSGDA